jgi:multiple sugar transport system substrate-binding protein
MAENPGGSMITRRAFLRTMLAVGGTTLLAACGTTGTSTDATTAPGATAAPGGASATAPAAGGDGGKLLVWGVVSFTPEGDAELGKQMTDWGAANNVAVEYVALPGSDYITKLAAAVETGALPDIAIMQGTDSIYYSAQGHLADISDVFDSIKGLGGGMYDSLLPLVQADGKTYGIPMQADVGALYARLDLCEQATGKREAPKTIDEMDAIMRAVNDPPKLFGYGMPLGRTADADGSLTWIMINDGGTFVDEQGNPTINNPGTISALTRLQSWWNDKLIPPDAPAWDDSSNNKAYQSRQAAFVTNPASIFAYLEQNDPELLAETVQAAMPAGKVGAFPGVGTWAWSLFNASQNAAAAKEMLIAIMQPELIEVMYEKVGGRWFPVYRDLAKEQFWVERPYFAEFPSILESARPAWYPATASPKLLTQLSAVSQKRIYAEMSQDVVVNGKSPEEAAAAAQTKMEQTFAEVA